MPAVGFRPRDDATYFPMPWLLSSRGRGVLALGDEAHRHRLGPASWSVEADGPRLDLRLIAGPRPADALRRLTALVGRQPAVGDQAVLGPWLQAAGDEEAALRRVRQAGAPLSLLQTYTHYLPCGDDRGGTAAERERTARAHAAGVSITTYVNPMVCTGYAQAYGAAAAAGGLGRAPGGGPYRYRYVGSTQFEVSQYDFSARAGERAFAAVARRAVRDGHDGWMEDFGEYTPLDLVSADGTPGPPDAQPLPAPLPPRRPPGGGHRRARALRALRLDRQRALLARRVGRRPDRRTGASTACARRCARGSRWG